MTGWWRARCRICPWRAKGDGPKQLGLDTLHAHLRVLHPTRVAS